MIEISLLRGRKFHFNIRITVFTLVCLTGFISLGFWQLDREEEKIALISKQEASRVEPVIKADDFEFGAIVTDGLSVSLFGTYLEEFTLLLDNVVLKGQVGFEVVQLFADNSGRQVLVNRGFVPMGRTRDDPVSIPFIGSKQVEVLGRIYLRRSTPLMLGSAEVNLDSFPVIVQQIDFEGLNKRFNKNISPFIVRLDEGQEGALPRYWPETVMPPERHRGYAIQWFMMAIVIVIAWLFVSFPMNIEK